MIPKSILLKVNPVDIEIDDGVKVKTSIIDDNPGVVSKYLEEFKLLIIWKNVVGFDVKTVQYRDGSKKTWGVVCVETRCLVFLVDYTILEEGIGEFLNNQDVCFIGTEVGKKVQSIKNIWDCEMSYETVVEIGYFAARVLMRAELETLELPDLASVVIGIKREVPSAGDNLKLKEVEADPILMNGAEVFSIENLKSLLEEACTCFAIANKVVTSMV